MIALIFIVCIVLYSLGGAATRELGGRQDLGGWSSDFAESACSSLWPAYWTVILAFGVVVAIYWTLSGAWLVALLNALDRHRRVSSPYRKATVVITSGTAAGQRRQIVRTPGTGDGYPFAVERPFDAPVDSSTTFAIEDKS